MNRKQIVDVVIAVFLIICGSLLLVLPIFHYIKIKTIFMGVFALYSILNLVQYILTHKSKDIEGLLTFLASIIALVIAWKLDIASVPWYLALTLFIWIIMKLDREYVSSERPEGFPRNSWQSASISPPRT